MSDTETTNNVADIEQPLDSEPITTAKKSGRSVMTEQKLANLEKARAARKANLDAKKYSQDKRGRAEERIEEEVDRRAREKAEKLAEELIKQRELEKELKEYRDWKKRQAELQKEDVSDQGKTKKKPVAAKAKPKPTPKPKKKRVPDSETEEDDEYVERVPKRGGRRSTIPMYQEPDWLSNVLD